MLSRRAFVGKLAAGAAVASAAGAGLAKAASARVEPSVQNSSGQDEVVIADGEGWLPGPDVTDAGPAATLTSPAPWELLRPLELGSVVANGWRVVELSGVVSGTCVLTLQNDRGRSHRVHVCRNDGQPRGLVFTKRLDLLVMNGGQADLPTDEGLAQAVAEVAHVLAANESRQDSLVVSLLPHDERVRLFSGAEDRRLR